MKLVMTRLVRDEIAIIYENIDSHIAAGVNHFAVTDDASVDGMLEKIEHYAQTGVVTMILEETAATRPAAFKRVRQDCSLC